MTGKASRRRRAFSGLVTVSLVALTLPALGARAAVADEAGTPPAPCITALQPPRLVLGSGDAPVRLTGGGYMAVDTSAVGDAQAVLVQAVATAAAAPTRLYTSLPDGSQRRSLLTMTAGAGAATGLVPLAGNAFMVGSSADVDVRLRIFGVVRGDCFEWAAPVTLLGSDDAPVEVPAGGEVIADLVRPDFLPRAALSSAVGFRFRAPDAAASVEVATPDGALVATHAVAAGGVLDVLQPLPPTELGSLVVRASGGPVEIATTALGWFRDATSYHPHHERLVASPPLVPGLPVASPLYDPDIVALPEEARDAVAVVLSVRVSTTAGVGGSARIWPTGYAQPGEPTVSTPSAFVSTEQTVVLLPGIDGSLWVEATSGTDWSVDVLGWSSNPNALNVVADNVTIAESGEVAIVEPPTADDPDVHAVVEYTGPDQLRTGDVLVSQASDALPEGLLSVVTAVRSEDEGTQVVETEAASLFDVMPSGEVSESVPADSEDAAPVEEPPPAPADTPPDETAGAAATAGEAPVSAMATGIGGGIPGRARVQCSGGVGAEVSASLRLSGSLNLQASWRPWNSVTADFGFSGSVAGEIRAWVGAKASCSGTVNLGGPRLPTFHIPIGPLWVPVSPEVSLQVRLSGEMEAGITASARAEAGVSAGVRYANGNFSPYFSPWFTASAGVDAKAYAQASLEVTPRVTFKLYHAVGPYVEVGAFAEARVEPGATPWWKVDAGVRAGVGVRLDVWKIRIGYDAPKRELLRRTVAQAGGGYPGPVITAGSLPSGQTGTFYDRVVPSQGGAAPLRWYKLSGSTPPGLTFRQDGHLVGTPTTSGTWTFRVRAIDAAGYRSTSDRDIAVGIGMPPPPSPSPTPTQTTPPPPGPSVTISKGASAVGLAGCSHSSCRWIDVSVTRFPANTRVTIVCRASNGDEGGFYTYFKTTDGAGNGWWPGGSGGGCYYGFPGRQFWVTVNGVESNRITW